MTLLILSLALALGVSGLCSLLEAILLSLPPSQVGAMKSRHPRAAALWANFKKNFEKPIAAILVLNTAAHTVGATVAGAQFEGLFGEKYLLPFSLLLTYFMLQFTEIMPKTLGVRYNRFLAPKIALLLNGLVRVLTPVLTAVHFVNRPFEGPRKEHDTTMEEIASLASSAKLARLIDPKQEQMIQAASRLDDMVVRQIMTPRTEVVYLSLDRPVEESLKIVQNSPFTRLPLCRKDIDQIVGWVHVKDLFKQFRLRSIPEEEGGEANAPTNESGKVAPPDEKEELEVLGRGIDLMKIRRDMLFMPERLPAIRALRKFQEARQHLAMIVDEYGSTLGILTLEDVMEEVVGEIEDEFDLPAPPLIVRQESGYRVSGALQLHQLAQQLPEVSVQDTDVSTVGGYVAKRLGRIPEQGDEISWGPYLARVTSTEDRRVGEVLLLSPDGQDAQEEPE